MGRAGQGFAAFDAFADAKYCLADMLVADAGAVDREGLQQRNAGAVHHREGAGEARQGDAFEDAADDGQP